MTDPLDLHAWVDESVHLDAAPSGLYILAAAIGAAGVSLNPVRDVLRALVVGPHPRLHWRDELESTRAETVDAIAELGLTHVVVVRADVDPKRQERARRKCLERLLFELSSRRVGRVWLEARTPTLNRRDIKLVDAVRSTGILADLSVDFARPLEEPLLWVPDAVAGAVASTRKKSRADYRERLAHVLEEIEL